MLRKNLKNYFNKQYKIEEELSHNISKEKFIKTIKKILLYSLLSILTFYNIVYFYFLTFFPFPFFGWITLFILSSIWMYLILKSIVYVIFKLFNINKTINKLYLFLPYPVLIGSWFAFSFVPVEWQPSFREFERLCDIRQSKQIIYDKILYDKNWLDTKFPTYLEKESTRKINWRLTEEEVFWYDKETDKLFYKFYVYKWLDIGMFAKYKREMICSDIERYKKLREKRGY